MTIPNVYMNWCQRKATCKWCEKTVEAGTPMVNVFFWNKGREGAPKWNVKWYYHPQCWVEQGLDYLKMNPYVSKNIREGITKLSQLSEKEQKHRITLMRRKAALDQRRKNIKAGYPDRILVEARLDKQVAEIMVKIAEVGGIPPKWLDNLL